MLPLLSERRLAQRIVVVTSKWDRVDSRSTDHEVEQRRLESTTFCKAVRQHGGDICHLDNSPESAWEALDFLLGLGTVPLKLFKNDLKNKMVRRAKSEFIGFRRWVRGLFSGVSDQLYSKLPLIEVYFVAFRLTIRRSLRRLLVVRKVS
jgi:hypothetical protein